MTSVAAAEVAKFDALAGVWWDPRGPMRALHAMNPARIGWIDARLARGSAVLDIGCGAGLAAEALARAGHVVVGVDAAPAAIDAARDHAPPGLTLSYRCGAAEDLLRAPARYDAVTALEVIEHVDGPAAFVATLARLLRPGGRLFLSTLNRTPAAFAVAKIGAEYLLRLLPAGTHDVRKFVTPAELAGFFRAAGLQLTDITGVRPSLDGRWRAGGGLAINYIACAVAA